MSFKTDSYFTNDALNLGSLSSGPLSGNTLTLQATLSVTGAKASGGFYGDMIIGDPPQLKASTAQFAQAMAGLGVAADEGWGAFKPSHVMAEAPMLVAAVGHGHAWA